MTEITTASCLIKKYRPDAKFKVKTVGDMLKVILEDGAFETVRYIRTIDDKGFIRTSETLDAAVHKIKCSMAKERVYFSDIEVVV